MHDSVYVYVFVHMPRSSYLYAHVFVLCECGICVSLHCVDVCMCDEETLGICYVFMCIIWMASRELVLRIPCLRVYNSATVLPASHLLHVFM